MASQWHVRNTLPSEPVFAPADKTNTNYTNTYFHRIENESGNGWKFAPINRSRLGGISHNTTKFPRNTRPWYSRMKNRFTKKNSRGQIPLVSKLPKHSKVHNWMPSRSSRKNRKTRRN